MVIAVDTRCTKEYRHLIYETFKRIATQQPQHSFIFISDKTLDASFINSGNIIPEVIKQAKIRLLSQLKTASLLKKYKADVFVTEETVQSKTPQLLIASGKVTPASLKRAQIIITPSESIKKVMIEKYKLNGNRIDVVYQGADEGFQPLPFESKEKIKEQHTGGNEYFLSAVTTEHNLLNLLKAFSVFKKMQKSSMRLLITPHAGMKEFSETLRLYKFNSEVNVLGNMSDNGAAEITGAAYAFVYPFTNGEYSQVLKAMKCAVPIIVSTANETLEILNDAALYVDQDNHKDIADKMMLVYKDENLRQLLVEKGKEQKKKYTWTRSAEQLWGSIQKAVN